MNKWSDSPSKDTVKGAALIDKAFQVIDIVGMSPGHASVQHLLRETGWTRPTLYRILAAVTANGFLRHDSVAQGYTLGYRLLELAQNVWSGPDLASIASNELRHLRDMTGETAYLAVLHNKAMMALGKFEGTHTVRSAAKLGIRKPLHCTSQGKAVLAFLSDDEIEKFLKGAELEKFTENTITNVIQLRSELSIVRQRGYAVENEEIIAGNRCVGAPIFDSAGKPIGAISVAGPVWRLTKDRVEQLGPELILVARNISVQLRGNVEPSLSGRQHLMAHPGSGKPAFYGADPVWDEKRKAIVWTDRLGPAVIETSATSSKIMRPPQDEPIKAFYAAEGGFRIWQNTKSTNLLDGKFVSHASADVGEVTAAAVHPSRMVWFATREPNGTAIRCPGTPAEAGWQVAGNINALAWAPDGLTLFAADAERGTIYSLQMGSRNPRIFSRISRASGEPRALATDRSGRLWVALYDGWSVARVGPNGEIESVTALPIPRPTGLTFGGTDNSDLFVTSARVGLTRDVLDNAPLSGHLLVIGEIWIKSGDQ